MDQQIPTTGVRADGAWRRDPGSALVHTTLTGTAAARLAKGLNALPKSILGVHDCPMTVAENEVVVTFRAARHG